MCHRLPFDDNGINNDGEGGSQAVLLTELIDQVKQVIAQIVLYYRMARLVHSRLVWRWFPNQIDTHELTQAAGVVQGFPLRPDRTD